MAKKRSDTPASASSAVTADRAASLHRLLTLLGKGPQTRAGLTHRLQLGIRGFYRDLEMLRTIGITLDLAGGRYSLDEKLADAIDRLPFPDPGLTLGEAKQLAKGQTPAHRKLKKQIRQIIK